ncbi:hypothetical protein FRX31_026148 [Thalictrum thalictroides]|uniref:Uncharacterized protein n=1 Tax=Thalictrum thalictroides TaxID=46969 RepID=A0A7J6VJ82_THATH|nr:hypothetical protein FRX31_026148 [Thalictrum thalictroides]
MKSKTMSYNRTVYPQFPALQLGYPGSAISKKHKRAQLQSLVVVVVSTSSGVVISITNVPFTVTNSFVPST